MDYHAQNCSSKKMSDTIAAIATPPGRGGVGIIRVSGPKAVDVGRNLTAKKILNPRVADFARFYSASAQTIDSGIIVFFPNPRSFTGEDVVEIQAHGSPVVLDMLLGRVIELGARLARPGEFSERAFLNDKIDLVQAEAIADLIASGTEQAAVAAQRSLQGDFSNLIDVMVKELIGLRTYVEAALDFPDEEIDFLSDSGVLDKMNRVYKQLLRVEKQARQGVLLSEGVNLAIIGKPNVGKSTLLNALAGDDLAIVTPIAGTTRDVIKTELHIDGLRFNITDTAGLRETNDVVERAGIDKAHKELGLADLVLLVLDASLHEGDDFSKDYPGVVNKKFLVVRNKTDLTSDDVGVVDCGEYTAVNISAADGGGVDALRSAIKKCVGHVTDVSNFIARRRHLTAVDFARQHVKQAIDGISTGVGGEVLAEELRLAQNYLQEITGRFSADDLLGKIFSEFCIGK